MQGLSIHGTRYNTCPVQSICGITIGVVSSLFDLCATHDTEPMRLYAFDRAVKLNANSTLTDDTRSNGISLHKLSSKAMASR